MCSTIPLLLCALTASPGSMAGINPGISPISVRLTDAELDIIRGGKMADSQMAELVYEHADRSMSIAGGISREMTGLWWATAGADLIHANLTP